jgi:hypothetical protein
LFAVITFLLLTPSPDCCCNCVPLGMHAS